MIITNILITLGVGLVYFYVRLPAINLQDPNFYGMIFLLAAVYCVLALLRSGSMKEASGVRSFFLVLKKTCVIPAIVCGLLIIIYLIGSLISAPIFRASSYSEILDVKEGNFTDEVKEISFDQIPMLDKDSAERLGNRKLGELSDMVSQFEVASDYSQINYQGKPVRVTPLEYGDWIKWFNNRGEGLPAYIKIDMVTQNAEVVRLEEGVKYTTSEHFFQYLDRHLRINYPTYMFGDAIFEIDEEGIPYWVCPRIVKTVGLFGGTDINGSVLVNAVTGECTYYESKDVPTWVDRVYSADLIVEQYDYHGTYQNGFFNSLFGQKGVTVTTDGYNYIAQDDDVYMYTGITSVSSDQSNIGFILTNQRTKATTFYSVAGATEASAQDSAEGLVQDLGYSATFPLLLNISSQPTYFMALKDSSNLVKSYAMVNVQYYQNAVIGSTVEQCLASYSDLILQQGLSEGEQIMETAVSGVVEDIRSAVIEGNSLYYVKLKGDDFYYVISAADSQDIVIIDKGDKVEVFHAGTDEGDLRKAYSINQK